MDPITVLLADRRRWLAMMALLLILGVAGLRVSAAPELETTGGRIPAPREGFLAPGFELKTLAGQQVSLMDFRGQVVILNLWASWCPPCRTEMPAFQSLYARYRERGLMVLALNTTYQDQGAEASRFASELGLTFPVLLDPSGQVSGLYRMRALPTTFFIDQEGTIQRVIIGGPISELTLESLVLQLLEGQD